MEVQERETFISIRGIMKGLQRGGLLELSFTLWKRFQEVSIWGWRQVEYSRREILKKIIYLLLVALGLRCCVQVFSSCCEQGLLFTGVRELLTAATSFVAKHRLQVQSFSSCGAWAQLLLGMWNPLGSRQEPSGIKVETHVPCIDRRILNHWAPQGSPFFLS